MGAAASVVFGDDNGANHDNVHQRNTANKIQKQRKAAALLTELSPEFTVQLASWDNPTAVDLPEKFILRLEKESLNFVHSASNSTLVQFPYQNIICWGSSSLIFQFQIFNSEPHHIRTAGISIRLNTHQGKFIEESIMKMVKALMQDMDKKAISKEEFFTLQEVLFDENSTLSEDWMKTIDQFSAGRSFLAKQGMELLTRIGDQAPFEKLDLACILYDRLLNHQSFQLLLSTFEDPQDRSNIIHRLGLKDVFSPTPVISCAHTDLSFPASGLQLSEKTTTTSSTFLQS